MCSWYLPSFMNSSVEDLSKKFGWCMSIIGFIWNTISQSYSEFAQLSFFFRKNFIVIAIKMHSHPYKLLPICIQLLQYSDEVYKYSSSKLSLICEWKKIYSWEKLISVPFLLIVHFYLFFATVRYNDVQLYYYYFLS